MFELGKRYMHKEIANTIIEQLGGNHFTTMTGAKNFSYNSANPSGNLSFKIPQTNGINYIHITLNSLDLYDVEYRMVRDTKKNGITNVLKAESKNIYCDMLRGSFERNTGLRTSLTRVYAD